MATANHLGVWLGLAALLFVCFIAWRWNKKWRSLFDFLSARLQRFPSTKFLWFFFALGTSLRIIWVLLYHSPQHSDQAAYFGLARGLVENHSYGISNGGLAYWPPGYPFFLASWFLLFGFKSWVPIVANIVLFGASLVVVDKLAQRIGGPAAGRLAILTLTFWPTMVMTAGLASKEMLVLFLLPLTLLIFTFSQDAGISFKGSLLAVLAGLLLGFASLTQPSLMLFPSVLIGCECFVADKVWRSLSRLVIVAVGLCLVILPWSLRNYRVFGTWVAISTNGGDVFYRANNPLATGGYTPSGQQSLEGLDEVQRGKVGFRLGKEWVRAHPGAFLSLAVRKQILFLGDDAQGAFETLKRGLGIGGLRYIAWKALCNMYWWVSWIVILLILAFSWRKPIARNALLAAVMLGILYLYSIHSVFESGSKYHEPLMGLFAVLVGQALAKVEPEPKRES